MGKILVVCDEKEPSVSLQQMPQSLKHLFVPAPGHSFIGLDAGQMEPRMLASLSGDENMINMFNSGQDYYSGTAALVYGIPVEEVDSEMRKKVKTVCIAMQYGMRDNTIARRLGISEAEAADLRARWEKAYPKAAAFRKQAIDYTMQTGKSPTFFGRYRDFGGADKMDDQKANEGFSNLIQGSAADVHKVCLVMVDKYFKEKGYGSIKISIHDEIIVEVPDEHVDEAKEDLLQIMKSSSKLRPDWCEFDFQIHAGKNWAECSK